MNTITVPIDFSKDSYNGLDLALIYADKLKMKIKCVHVLPEKIEKTKEVEDFVSKSTQDLLTKYKHKCPNGIEIKIHTGKIFQEVINEANQQIGDLIITSTHGHSGFEELFIGSNAYKIIAMSDIPVITMRGSQLPKNIKKIVVPLDLSDETREKIPYVTHLAQETSAEIHLITLSEMNDEWINDKLHNYAIQASNYIKHHDIHLVKDHIKGHNVADLTLSYAKGVEADLITIMSEQENSLKNILLGSNAHRLISKSSIPVLSIPTRQMGILAESFKAEGINY